MRNKGTFFKPLLFIQKMSRGSLMVVQQEDVHKQGTAVGRSLDPTKFNGYNELTTKLDQILEFNGKLAAPNKDRLIVSINDEGDMILVGDYPWL
uniref:PB1 domain-containing protein n=1 Tax=Populus trichocarpa TaxID=3694 RepID=A0A2K1XKY3_POPTR